jgi:hypothetical protein
VILTIFSFWLGVVADIRDARSPVRDTGLSSTGSAYPATFAFCSSVLCSATISSHTNFSLLRFKLSVPLTRGFPRLACCSRLRVILQILVLFKRSHSRSKTRNLRLLEKPGAIRSRACIYSNVTTFTSWPSVRPSVLSSRFIRIWEFCLSIYIRGLMGEG